MKDLAGFAAGSAIEFVNVTKEYAEPQRTVALERLSLQVKTGEIFGVVGESGAGKSTFLELLLGLKQPTSGQIRILGSELVGREIPRLNAKLLREMRRNIGAVFQADDLISSLTVSQNVELPLRLTGRKDGSRVKMLLDFVGLKDRGVHFPAELSGGQRQRVAIARALMTGPKIVLFDEPTSALDVAARGEVLRLIKSTNQEFGTTCVLVSHDLEAVKSVCERAIILSHGRTTGLVDVKKQTPAAAVDYSAHAREFLSR